MSIKIKMLLYWMLNFDPQNQKTLIKKAAIDISVITARKRID